LSHRLTARGLCKTYQRRQVVASVDLAVASGEVVGLLGPNGAGKTTSFYMVVGLVRPDAGQVLLDEQDLTRVPMHQRARLGISYLAQEPSVFRRLTVEQNLLAILETIEKQPAARERRKDRLLEEFRLQHVARSFGYALSGGERRRTEIARALVLEPRFMLLDEPFAGIDPIAVLDIQEIIVQLKERGIGVLISDHNVRETLKLVDRAYLIHNGEVVYEGAAEALVDDPKAREIYLGPEFNL